MLSPNTGAWRRMTLGTGAQNIEISAGTASGGEASEVEAFTEGAAASIKKGTSGGRSMNGTIRNTLFGTPFTSRGGVPTHESVAMPEQRVRALTIEMKERESCMPPSGMGSRGSVAHI